ncbi:MAG: hypothetical protein ACK6DC_07140 [Planctomycetota bacterium]
MESRRHFSGLGQRIAATLWFADISKQIAAPKPSYLAQVARLPQLHLREPVWKSTVGHRPYAQTILECLLP